MEVPQSINIKATYCSVWGKPLSLRFNWQCHYFLSNPQNLDNKAYIFDTDVCVSYFNRANRYGQKATTIDYWFSPESTGRETYIVSHDSRTNLNCKSTERCDLCFISYWIFIISFTLSIKMTCSKYQTIHFTKQIQCTCIQENSKQIRLSNFRNNNHWRTFDASKLSLGESWVVSCLFTFIFCFRWVFRAF